MNERAQKNRQSKWTDAFIRWLMIAVEMKGLKNDSEFSTRTKKNEIQSWKNFEIAYKAIELFYTQCAQV